MKILRVFPRRTNATPTDDLVHIGSPDYVFRGRINPLHNGKETDENGKPWSSTMCFAWFVWDNKFQGDPSIRWIE
jgi:hypothetical protein